MRRTFRAITISAALTVSLPWAASHFGGSSYAASYAASVYVTGRASYFYDDLAPYGEWFEVPRYGWVWCPVDAPIGWRPYTVGYWVYTDWGWMWISEDPWGWAPYHYGRWDYSRHYGWIWIPGDVW